MKTEHILIKPVLTEKASQMASTSVYTFKVAYNANKNQITQAIETLYKVKVDTIRVHIRPGKEVKAGRRGLIKKQPDYKIAFIKLAEGKIDLFPQA